MLAPALTILLSSFLLFLVQPIIAKQILPWFGGSAGVWMVCLVFFQLVLLFGYSYAHWLTRRRGARQFVLHVVLLLVSCALLPIVPAAFWKPGPDSAPALRILGLLAATVGLPYLLLASTAPLLQKWLSGAMTDAARKRSIYRLFALSNLGSLAGLLSYPFAIEPAVGVRLQAQIWSYGYLLFVACLIAYAWQRRRLPHAAAPVAAVPAGAAAGPAPSPRRYAYWIGCAALGSALLLAVTNQITQNVAAIPFLWIVPLSLYLLSFVVCFEGRSGRGWYERRWWLMPALLAVGTMAWALYAHQANLSMYAVLPIDAVGLFFGCVMCHGELARSKPDPDYLTHFYLSLATGGALGGLLVGLAAPRVFDSYWEMPLALIGLAVLGLHACSEQARAEEMGLRPRASRLGGLLLAALAAGLILAPLGAWPTALYPYTAQWSRLVTANVAVGLALLLLAALLLQRLRLYRAIAVAALLCTLTFDWSYYHNMSADTELAVRNFYGALRVKQWAAGMWHIRMLAHGVVVHGTQVMEPPQSLTPTTYYGESSGIGRTILIEGSTKHSLRIGSIGLGTGTLAAYGRPGDLFRVYELNPAVVEIARHQFTYLEDSKARIEMVLGDARLSLEREIAQGAFDRPEQRFDILSVDAFSGDAIPVHLLTRQAFDSYARVIKPDGVIAFHLSNRYLDLAPVVALVARDAGFHAVLIADRPVARGLISASDWALVTRSAAFLEQPEIAAYSSPIALRPGVSVWTDQFSNLFRILK